MIGKGVEGVANYLQGLAGALKEVQVSMKRAERIGKDFQENHLEAGGIQMVLKEI